jgi:hypothetical protein
LSFAKGVSALLKTVGLEYDRNGVKFSPYSLRHPVSWNTTLNQPTPSSAAITSNPVSCNTTLNQPTPTSSKQAA